MSKPWPTEAVRVGPYNVKEVPMRATKVLRKQVGELRRRMVAQRKACAPGHPTEKEIKTVREDWVEAIWMLREQQMDLTQKRRAAHVLRYRPIQTLDGLDPAPLRVVGRELANGFYVLGRALRG